MLTSDGDTIYVDHILKQKRNVTLKRKKCISGDDVQSDKEPKETENQIFHKFQKLLQKNDALMMMIDILVLKHVRMTPGMETGFINF